ncbi:ester hydrolase C11orf54 homolog [Microplitis mediator]|uniref:ester hydrolase C11orf54 homolog n=1 Tax=Microplitis mediator TaxID=375433 RepID=UPI002555BE6D|nr:ester hydrolase C11orf54 homolog [Microplitis mediator]XP_057330743.1 ester hydrolase C11orf54 homolog [Microplitis mediator]
MDTRTGKNLNICQRSLFTPTLNDIKNVISPALSKNFSETSVEVVDCPDLRESPFKLASAGLGGHPKLFEIGGPPFLLPCVQRDKIYDVQTILKQIHYGDKAFIIGAGAGPWPQLSRNCEMMMNLVLDSTNVINETKLAWVGEENQCVLQKCVDSDTRLALLANLFISEGKPGKVLKVHAKTRIGDLDFIASIQKALSAHYKDQLVGLGGTFLLKKGKAKQHVMPDFSSVPLTTEESMNNWLRFYDMSAPLVAVGTLVSSESDLDLRVQHFHSFSDHGEGGHYHIDVTPSIVEYLGYFNIADCLYRIDQPTSGLTFGKD